MDCGLWSGCRLEPWRVRAACWEKIRRRKERLKEIKFFFFYLLNIIGIIYG